jgi:hypothetical protein
VFSDRPLWRSGARVFTLSSTVMQQGSQGPGIGILMERFDRILFEVFGGVPRVLALKEDWRRKVPH